MAPCRVRLGAETRTPGSSPAGHRRWHSASFYWTAILNPGGWVFARLMLRDAMQLARTDLAHDGQSRDLPSFDRSPRTRTRLRRRLHVDPAETSEAGPAGRARGKHMPSTATKQRNQGGEARTWRSSGSQNERGMRGAFTWQTARMAMGSALDVHGQAVRRGDRRRSFSRESGISWTTVSSRLVAMEV
jgi:hypothetical protein